ncbi:MAG: ROK family protein, partial [Bacteroidota bacterium]|nr:ROK family protein [Bacteroidota bacterium]
WHRAVRLHEGHARALASGHRIASLGEKLIQRWKSSLLQELVNANSGVVDAKIIALAAIKGDKECVKIYNEITDYLCIGIRDIINVLNPEAIFIGGGISLAGDFFFNMINEKIPAYLFKSKFKVPIYPTTFGEQATLMGAISLVVNKILNFELDYQLNDGKVSS